LYHAWRLGFSCFQVVLIALNKSGNSEGEAVVVDGGVARLDQPVAPMTLELANVVIE
jgi:hypothetical protein